MHSQSNALVFTRPSRHAGPEMMLPGGVYRNNPLLADPSDHWTVISEMSRDLGHAPRRVHLSVWRIRVPNPDVQPRIRDDWVAGKSFHPLAYVHDAESGSRMGPGSIVQELPQFHQPS